MVAMVTTCTMMITSLHNQLKPERVVTNWRRTFTQVHIYSCGDFVKVSHDLTIWKSGRLSICPVVTTWTGRHEPTLYLEPRLHMHSSGDFV